MNNCNTCFYNDRDCQYKAFRVSLEDDINNLDGMEVFELKCHKYEEDFADWEDFYDVIRHGKELFSEEKRIKDSSSPIGINVSENSWSQLYGTFGNMCTNEEMTTRLTIHLTTGKIVIEGNDCIDFPELIEQRIHRGDDLIIFGNSAFKKELIEWYIIERVKKGD